MSKTNNTQQKAQKKQSILSYYNSHFPAIIRDKFQYEREISHQSYDQELQECFQNRDINKIFNELRPKKVKIDYLYGLNQYRQNQLSECLLYMGLEENYISLDQRFFSCGFSTKSVINWQPLWEQLQKRIFINDVQNTNTSDVSQYEIQAFLILIKRLRSKFDDSSIQEVYNLYKKLCLANNELLGLILLRYFLKITRKTSKDYYIEIFEEINQTINYDLSKRKQLVLLNILYELAITHPELQWEKSYENLFSFISRCYIQILPLGLATKQQQQKISYLYLQNINDQIQKLIVHLIVPSTEVEKHQQIWDHIKSLFNIINQYLHPNQEGSGAVKYLLQQLQQFITNYIHLHSSQQKAITSIEKSIENLKKKLNEDQQQNNLNNEKMQEDLDDQGIETDLLNENSEQQTDNFCEIKKGQGEDDNINELGDLAAVGGQERLLQYKLEDEIEEEDDDDDEEDEDDDEQQGKEKKTQEELQQQKQNLEKRLQQLEEKLKTIKQFQFDKSCHEKFESIIEPLLRNILHLNDSKGEIIPQFCKDLCCFNAEKFIPIILDVAYEVFEKTDMNFLTIVQVLTQIVVPLLDRKNYKKGFYLLPNLMRKVFDILTPGNFQQALKIWKFYSSIFLIVPVNNVDDLFKQYQAQNKDKSYSDFYQEMNKDEDENIVQVYEQLNDITYSLFQKFLTMFEHIDMPRSKNTRGIRSSMLSVLNIFSSIAFSVSDTLFKQLWKHAFNCISDKQQTYAQKLYSYLLHSFCLRDPKIVLSSMIPLIFSQFVHKRHEGNYEQIKKQPLYYLIEKHPNREEILKYEIESVNKNSLFWYLYLLEDTVYFGRQEILKYKNEIETIIFLCLVHEEIEIFKKICQIIQKIIQSLITFYPSEYYIWSKNELKDDNNYIQFYHRYIGQNKDKKFSLDWHVPTKEEEEYAKELFYKIYDPIMKQYQEVHFKDISTDLDYQNKYEEILDGALSAEDNAQRNLKTELNRSIMLLFHLYSSVSIRAKQEIDESEVIYYNFAKDFCLKEYDNFNLETINFCSKLLPFLIKQNLYYDHNIIESYLTLILFVLGCDDQEQYINNIKQKLKGIKDQNSNPYKSQSNFPRFVEVTKIAVHFHNRIYYSLYCKFNSHLQKLVYPLLLLTMHPYLRISQKSIQTYNILLNLLKDEKATEESLNTYINFIVSKLTKQSDKFLPVLIEKAKQENSKQVPLLLTYLERIISSLRIIHSIRNRLQNYDLYQKILSACISIIESYNQFVQKDTKDKVIEYVVFFVLHAAQKLKKQYDSTKTRITYQNIYFQKNKIVQKFSLSQREYMIQDDQKQIQLKSIIDSIFERCTRNLQNEQTFYKEKIFALIIALKVVDLKDVDHPNFQLILQQALQFTIQEHLQSRNIGRCIVLKCIQCLKRKHKTTQIKSIVENDYINNQNKSLNDFFKYQLIRVEDIEDGFEVNQNQTWLIYKKSSSYEPEKENNIIYESFQDDNFIKQYFKHYLNDITTPTQVDQSLRQKNIFNNSELIFQAELIRNFKKQNLFKETNYYFFHQRVQKKIFIMVGYKFFKFAQEYIEQNKKDETTTEASYIVNLLVFSILQGLFSTELKISKQQKDEIFDYLMEIVNEKLYSLNLEKYQHFQAYLYNLISSLGFKDAYRVYERIESNQAFQNKQDQRYSRLIFVKMLLLQTYNINNVKIIENLVEEMKTINPYSIQMHYWYSQILYSLWSFYTSSINIKFFEKYNIVKDIQSYIQNEQLLRVDDQLAIKNPQQMKQIYEFIVQNINSDDVENKKKYYRLALALTNVFKVNNFQFFGVIYQNMDSLFPLYIAFKDEDISDQQVIQEYWANLIYLAQPFYGKQVLEKLFLICTEYFKNPNWRIRQKALVFYQFLAIFHHFRLQSFNYIEPIYEVLNDEQKTVKSLAQKVLSLLIKTYSVQKVSQYVQKMMDMAQSQDKEKKIIGIYCLMSVLLSFPNDILEWTEKAIRIILKNKKITPDTLTLLKEFGASFLKNTYHDKMDSKQKLPEDLIMNLEEISRPYNYFA